MNPVAVQLPLKLTVLEDGTKVISLNEANGNTNQSGYVSIGEQTFSGVKYFLKSPIITKIPSDPRHIVTKALVDTPNVELSWPVTFDGIDSALQNRTIYTVGSSEVSSIICKASLGHGGIVSFSMQCFKSNLTRSKNAITTVNGCVPVQFRPKEAVCKVIQTMSGVDTQTTNRIYEVDVLIITPSGQILIKRSQKIGNYTFPGVFCNTWDIDGTESNRYITFTYSINHNPQTI